LWLIALGGLGCVLDVLRVEKQLVCLRCGEVIGNVLLRPLAWTLRITAPGGWELVPETGAIQVRLAEQQIAAASSPGEEAEATARLAFIKRNIGELMYSLPCPRGHYIMATAPQITRAIRHSKGRQVRLQGQFG
jgi:hypothetical protein